jgi:phage tail-like protein
MARDYPYANFNYIVNLGGASGDGTTPVGGFSDVSGISTEVTYAEYRAGNHATNTTIKLPNTHKLGTLTLKRGVMGTTDLWDWLAQARDGQYVPRPITITLQDEQHKAVMHWQFTNAQPQKWTAPTLAGKGGTDVAMEEFVLVYEAMKVTQA